MNPFATALAETAMTEMEQTAAQAAIVGGLVALGVGDAASQRHRVLHWAVDVRTGNEKRR